MTSSNQDTETDDTRTRLTPAPDAHVLRHHPRVFNSLASSNIGRTANEIKCPHSEHMLPRCHGFMATCPCGLKLATWGNTMFLWPPHISLEPTSQQLAEPAGLPVTKVRGADAVYHGVGGTTFVLTPLTNRAYRALRAAGTDIAPGGSDWAGAYPSIQLSAPTEGNVAYDPRIGERYRAAVEALMGMTLHDDGDERFPYPVRHEETQAA